MKTLVIGDLNVDMIVRGAPQLPTLGHEIPCDDIKTVMGGAASIFASRLGQLGGEVDIFGKVGNDANGRLVLEALKSSNVGVDKVRVRYRTKTGITISLTYPENRALITYVDGIDTLTASDIKSEMFRGYDHLHVSSIYILRKLLPSLVEVFAEAKKQGLVTSLDTNADPLAKYDYVNEILSHVDIFFPNDKEAKDITGLDNVRSALDCLAGKVPTVAIKRGERGALGKHDGKIVQVNPIGIESVDTTGAGDSFDAGFIYYFTHKKEDFEVSMKFANALGALSCLYTGGAEQKITEVDVLNFMHTLRTVK
ncbi:MAG: carbohydrate kinase family protein [Candidatus Bathyarchaeota archaeon]|nr:carbohydrate kinase family protein [Candidatus Bathyarchaeota archaeon]